MLLHSPFTIAHRPLLFASSFFFTTWRLGYNTIVFYLNKSLNPPFLRFFEKKESWASCILYLDQNFAGKKLVITAADFDTW